MNSLQVFQNSDFGQVRVVTKNGEPWFVAKDVCEILEIGNPSQAVARLDDDERGLILNDTPSGPQEMTHVNESGLYSLILGSRKPEARKFKKWVTSEILPTIRRHGLYATDNVIEQILSNPDYGIQLLTTLKDERQKRLKAEQTNNILMHVNKTYTATEIAKELGFKSATELNTRLAEQKIQYKQNNTWVLYSKYANRGYVEIKQDVLDSGKVIYHRRWTQLGREFLLNLLTQKEVAHG